MFLQIIILNRNHKFLWMVFFYFYKNSNLKITIQPIQTVSDLIFAISINLNHKNQTIFNRKHKFLLEPYSSVHFYKNTNLFPTITNRVKRFTQSKQTFSRINRPQFPCPPTRPTEIRLPESRMFLQITIFNGRHKFLLEPYFSNNFCKNRNLFPNNHQSQSNVSVPNKPSGSLIDHSHHFDST